MGAEAYAYGNNLAFAGTPSLHTVAHETTHALQQQRGVRLKGGVGQVGDRHEQQADALADAVVRGECVGDHLGPPSLGLPSSLSVQHVHHPKLQKPTGKLGASGLPRPKHQFTSAKRLRVKVARALRGAGVSERAAFERPDAVQNALEQVALIKTTREAREQKELEDRGDLANSLSESIIEEIRNLAEDTDDTNQLQVGLEAIQSDYQLQHMSVEDLGTSQARVVFTINPTYEVKLAGSTQIAMRMLGTSAATNPFRTEVQWVADSLTLPAVTTPALPALTARVGYQMLAKPLSQDHQEGMVAGKNNDQDPLMGRLAKSSGSKNKYIKGHLLNDHLGGPAIADNLYPITDEANKKHVRWVEKYVKADIAAGYVVSYSVVVDPKPSSTPASDFGWFTPGGTVTTTNHPGQTINAKFKCEFSRLDTSGNDIPASTQKVTINSDYGQATSGYDPMQDSALTTNNRYGTINMAASNPTSGSLGAATEATYKHGGYNQGSMHTASMVSLPTTSTPFTVFPFFSSTTTDLRALLATPTGLAALNAVVKNKNASMNIMSWLATNATSHNIDDLGTVFGVGPVTLTRLKAAYHI